MKIKVAARSSKLSQAQVKEVQQALPHLELIPTLVATYGDLDKKTSLRSLNKTDFFTKEVDELVLNTTCDIAIHSAKDLPEPINPLLTIIAITKGVDPSDVLVLRPHESLPNNALIATSSERREEAVKKIKSDVRFVDVRGTIEERLEKLYQGHYDGVVIAEAALIRLNLTHLNRIRLKDSTTPLQGQLAIIALKDNLEMSALFSPLDVRRI